MIMLLLSLLIIGTQLFAAEEIIRPEIVHVFTELDALSKALKQETTLSAVQKQYYGSRYAYLLNGLKNNMPKMTKKFASVAKNIKRLGITAVAVPYTPISARPLPELPTEDIKEEIEALEYTLKYVTENVELFQREYIADTKQAMEKVETSMNDANLSDAFRQVAKHAYKRYKDEYDLFKMKEKEGLERIQALKEEIATLKKSVNK